MKSCRAKRDTKLRPSHVFHLAWSFNGAPGASPEAADAKVAAGVFDAVREWVPEAWVLLASSSAVYGSPDEDPISEDTPLRPITDYGRRKVACSVRPASANAAALTARLMATSSWKIRRALLPTCWLGAFLV